MINKIKPKVLEVLTKYNLTLYDLSITKFADEKGVSVLIDESIDHKLVDKVFKDILSEIENDLGDDLFLEVSTAGIERELKTIAEVRNNINHYIYLESNNYSGNANLDAVDDEDNLAISFFIKGRPKKLTVNYKDIKFIRQAIKF